MIKSLLLLSCAGFLSAGAFNTSTSKLSNGLLTNNKTEYKIETVEPTANWLFKNSSKIGYDSATKDGTNVYQLSTNGTVSLSEKGATIGESGSLYAASFAKDPTYKYSSQGFTFILNFSYETLGWTTSDGVLLQLRFSSADDNYSLFFPKNSNVLKFCSQDERTAGYSTYSDTIGTIDANTQYTLVFTRNNLGETKIYMNGLNGPVFTGSTASASFSSNWTTLSFGSESGSTTGGHSINRFTRHATGLSFSNISFYKGVVDEDGVSQYFATGEVQTKTPIPHQPEPEADYELIANSKLLSRVAYISDSHFRKGLTDPNNYGDSFVYAAINDIKSLNLDFDAVLNLGDLSESGMDRSNISLTNWYDWVDTNPLSNPDNSPVPFYGVLGNHDVRGDSNVSHTALERQEDFLKAAKVYQQREAYSGWGKGTYIHGSYDIDQYSPDLNYYTEIGGFHYIFMNTCECQWDVCYLTQDNLDWLDSTLTKLEQEDEEKPIFILIHQPIDYANDSIYLLDENGRRSNDIFAFHKVLAKHPTSVCCTGHTHAPLGINHRFQGYDFHGNIVPNFINMPSLEYNNYQDYAPQGVTGYELKKMVSYSNAEYYVCEIYENGAIFKGRDGINKKWITESYMGVHKKYPIDFKINGEVYDTVRARYGCEIQVPEVEPFIEGGNTCYLKKWINFNNICLEPASYEGELLKIPTGTQTYSTVTYNINGHGKAVEPKKIVNGVTVGNHPTLTERGYEFKGWYKDEQLTQKFDFYNEIVSSDITLYASWEAASNIQYRVDHYQETLDGTFKLAESEYLFGTYQQMTQAMPKNYEGFTSLEVKQQMLDLDKEVVIKIRYTRNHYTVTFKNGEEVISTTDYLYGETVVVPKETPTKPADENGEYIFTGWDKEVTIVTGDVIYNAVFKLKGAEKETKKNGCSGSIVATNCLVLCLGAFAASLILVRKRKED